ncbi:MAG: hypothetical protein KDA42_08955 [Planctomycetales bacterium]|nr:hypothetical protein [Planctomycetales bacterium]
MRALLVGVSVAAVASALFVWVGAVWAIAILFFGSLIAAHVAGNWMGSKLRQHAHLAESPRREEVEAFAHLPKVKGEHRPTKMQQHHRMGRIMLWSVVAISLTTSLSSAGIVFWQYADEISLAGIALSALAAGIIGGLGGYAVLSFIATTHTAWREAVRGEEKTA